MSRDGRLSSVLHVLLHMDQHQGAVTSAQMAKAMGYLDEPFQAAEARLLARLGQATLARLGVAGSSLGRARRSSACTDALALCSSAPRMDVRPRGVLFIEETFDVPEETRTKLTVAGIRIETEPVRALVAKERQLEAVQLSTGVNVPCDILFSHPPQRQVGLVQSLGVALDEHGYVVTDETKSETSIPGVYAAGDLTTRAQGAILAAAAGTRAASMLNVELTMELVQGGALQP